MLGPSGSCRGQPLREPTQHIDRRCQLFSCMIGFCERLLWVLGPETINEFQAISGGLKHFEATCWLAGLPVLQCMCPVLRNGAQIRDVWSISISFFWAVGAVGFGSRSNWFSALLAWSRASNVRAEQSWLEDEGVLMDRTAREAALIRK